VLMRLAEDIWVRPYSSFIMIARSVAEKPILTQFCLFMAASPGLPEWKICWLVQSLSVRILISGASVSLIVTEPTVHDGLDD